VDIEGGRLHEQGERIHRPDRFMARDSNRPRERIRTDAQPHRGLRSERET
jgi:hypothetical protein